MTLTIGLTGSIATGKSTISKMFKELNIPVVDADLIAREVVEVGKPAYQKIVETFGKVILQTNKEIDRKQLGAIIFADEKKRKQLNDIVHPAIREEMLRQKNKHITNKEKCVVLDIPLLFESKLFHFVDKVLVVYTDEEIQIKRLIARDKLSKEEALKRMNSQISIEEKKKQADAIINNNGTKEQSAEQLKALLQKWGIL
ncbi:MAG TPA: dephospho-CoA kinase [Bacillota bacterium]|nr:dephospho-CoA kinase [Bacillota bacterium]